MKITKVWLDGENIYVQLNSGHIIGNPLAWYPRLANATDKQREQYQIEHFGDALRWEEIDEDLCLRGFLDFEKKMLYPKEAKEASIPKS